MQKTTEKKTMHKHKLIYLKNLNKKNNKTSRITTKSWTCLNIFTKQKQTCSFPANIFWNALFPDPSRNNKTLKHAVKSPWGDSRFNLVCYLLKSCIFRPFRSQPKHAHSIWTKEATQSTNKCTIPYIVWPIEAAKKNNISNTATKKQRKN